MLSDNLEKFIQEQINKISRNLIYKLEPYDRMILYNIFSDNQAFSEKYFPWLGILSAKQLISVWTNEYPEIKPPKIFLETAELIMLGKESLESGNQVANDGWEWLEKTGTQINSISAFYSAASSLTALLNVLEKKPFKDIVINENTVDDDLDPWSCDSTKWASFAYANNPRSGKTKEENFSQFYLWWLKTAIPQAIKLAEK